MLIFNNSIVLGLKWQCVFNANLLPLSFILLSLISIFYKMFAILYKLMISLNFLCCKTCHWYKRITVNENAVLLVSAVTVIQSFICRKTLMIITIEGIHYIIEWIDSCRSSSVVYIHWDLILWNCSVKVRVCFLNPHMKLAI
jgi:hypothetical protein